MPAFFAPNNNESSKILFTGRKNDLEEIINLIICGNCIALYGERRGGKTLTLDMLSMIINGGINTIIDSLIDQDLRTAIPIWQRKLLRYKSIYTSLHGIRTEVELVRNIINCVQPLGILSTPVILTINTPISGPKIPDRLGELLDFLQADCLSKSYKLVILVDEMEILEEFENNGSAVAELFCDQKRYSKILFIHTGSYQWNQRVSSPGSLFTHLEPHYLKSIQVDALRNYLLSPLNDNIKDFVIQLCGAKPLYAQYIGKYMVDNGKTSPGNELHTELLGNISLCSQIEQNIFHEARLDDNTKRILAVLAHHPKIKCSWIAEKLSLSKTETENILKRLSRFGTVVEEKNKYKIVGTIIEIYGRQLCDDPANDNYKQPPVPIIKKLTPFFVWATMFGLIAISLLFYNYYNPTTRIDEFVLSDLTLKIEVPYSLEANQAGEFNVTIASASDVKDIVVVVTSPQIRYDNNGESAIKVDKIMNGLPINRQIEYYVLPGDSKVLSTSVSIQGSKPHEFNVERRLFSLQRYSLWISALLSLIATIVPGKEWGAVIVFAKQLIVGKEKTS